MDEFIAYLTAQAEAGKAEIAALEADGRKDDANFVKVRTNIYEVCKTVTNALVNRPGFGADAVAARLAGFKTTWGDALDKALANDDTRGIAVAEAQLSALDDVIAHFPGAVG